MSALAGPVRVSVFTPSHDTRYLDEAYRSLRNQSFPGWEWIVLLNGKASTWAPPEADERVHVRRAPAKIRGRVGALKRAACELATGQILLELDHDDVISRGCLAQVVDAFVDPKVVLVYSDFAQINEDGSPNDDRFDPSFGWVYTQGTFDDATYDRCHAMAPTPHNVGYIWYAPNHVRAFRRSTYQKVGGYNAELEFLDDQELMSRLYLEGDFAQIKRCLYLQRVHPHNTQRQERINAAIQEQTVVYYRQFIEDLTLAWARRRGLRCLRLRTPIWIGDEPDERYEDVVVDPDQPTIDAAKSSVAVLKAYDVLQRLPKRAPFFNECYRVMSHAGLIMTQTPSSDGRGAFQDPSHTAFYNENSFMYITQKVLRQAIPDLTSRWQVSHLRTFFPSPGHVDMKIPYVQANLLAVKDGPRQGGPLLS
jgi:glycosyltransferase involved in cell wall biosynthesis